MTQQKLIGYPSKDKPWLKYYSEEALSQKLPDQTMFELIYEANKNRQHNIAIHYYGNDISFKKLFESIKNVASVLWNKGIRKGDIITVISLGTPETKIVIYALNYIGAVANLVSPSLSKQDLIENMRETDSKLIFILDKILDKIGEIDINIPIVVLPMSHSMQGMKRIVLKTSRWQRNKYTLYNSFITENNAVGLKIATDTNTPAVIVYTSGTTGIPKGVVLSNRNLNTIAFVCPLSGKDYKPNEKFLDALPPFVGYGIAMIHLAMYTGVTQVTTLIPETKQMIKTLKKHRIEHLAIGPALIDVIEKNTASDLSYICDLTGGGGEISLEKERKINLILKEKKARSKYLAGYGMTELASGAAMNTNGHVKEQSAGIPLVLMNAKVIDINNKEELGYNQEGELLICSPGLMLGYYNNPDETSRVIEEINGERWIHTGDLAKIDEDGFIFITGRLKRIYTAKGKDGQIYKLFPNRLEELIDQNENVFRSGVIVVETVERIHAPIAFVELKEEFKNTDKESMEKSLKQYIDQTLPDYYNPLFMYFIDKMPITSSQKIDYQDLEKMIN